MKKGGNEVLEYLTTWMNFENIILSKKKIQTYQKSMHSILWLQLWNTPYRQIFRNKVD